MLADPFSFAESDCTIMIFLTGYFDESGKVQDSKQRVTCVAGFISHADRWRELHFQWQDLLFRSGLPELKSSQALRFRMDLSRKVSAKGERARIEALLPFVQTARTHAEFGLVSAVDADAFRRLDSHSQRNLEGDPYYLAFVSVMANMEKYIQERYAGETVKAGIIFDYDSKTSMKCLGMYSKM